MLKTSLAVAALAALPFAASAATINVSVSTAGAYNATFGTSPAVTETFEGFKTEGQVGANFATAVGTFNTIGGVGSGGTVTQTSQPSGNTGQYLAVRDGNVFGRTNLVPAQGSKFLDSNDTYGMIWNVSLPGSALFSSLSFLLQDASDTGAFLRIMSGGASVETRTATSKLSNGNIRLVTVDFGGAVSSATVTLGNFTSLGGSTYKKNDGFSVDGLQVYTTPVPVPGSMVLLGTAVAAAGFAAKRRKAKAAA